MLLFLKMNLLPAILLLQQKLEYYPHHPRLVPEVCKEFEAVKEKLSRIIPFLRYMNVSLTNDENIKAWRQTLKDLEDEVDKIMIFFSSPILGLGHQLSFMFRRIHLKKQLMEVRRLGEEIQKIMTGNSPDTDVSDTGAKKQSLNSLGSRKYGIRPSAYDRTRENTIAPAHYEFADKIENLLMNYKDKRFKVIGVIGKKGIGKSKLVSYVYNNEKVRKYFDCYAWISNPSSVDPKDILREMLNQFYFESPPYALQRMDQPTLLLTIQKCLVGKRFLLVLDGVSDFEIWKQVIFCAFPVGAQLASLGQIIAQPAQLGPIVFTSSFLLGRIVFTSSSPHKRIFSSLVKKVYVSIRLEALSQDEPWHLFRELVFQDQETPGTCPPELENIAKKITKKSNGLLFVIRLLAGVLRGESRQGIWQNVLRQWEELDQHYADDTVKAILLSYDALDLSLKSCFLYFSSFPRDGEILVKSVIQLWVAEGLVKVTGGRTATEVSMDNFQELIDRALIQPARLDAIGDVESCIFDDQVRRVALDIIAGSNAQNLDQGINDGSSGTASFPSLHHRHIQGKNIKNIISDAYNVARIRSCIVSRLDESSCPILPRFLSGFQLLRVLDLDLKGSGIKTLPNNLGALVHLIYLKLEGSTLEEVPASALGNLILLRYLGLRRTGIRELPASLSHLEDLHTLDMRDTKLRRLPRCVSKLPKLQHIYLCCSFRREFVEMPLGKEEDKRPQELQTLAGVRATTNLIQELGKWGSGLRKLSIGRLTKADSVKFCESIEKMTFLRSLSIRSDINESIDMGSLASSSTTNDNLDTLRIGGSVEALKSAIGYFPSLCRLFLWDNLLKDDPLRILQVLPNLMVLCLTNAFQGEELSCGTNGFPKLKTLSIFQLRNLERWQINDKGMKKLECLSIGHCPNLRKPLQDLEKLPSLKLVKVAEMDEKFTEETKRIGKESEDRIKVLTVPLFKDKESGATTGQKLGTRHEEVSEAAGSKGSSEVQNTSEELPITSGSIKKRLPLASTL